MTYWLLLANSISYPFPFCSPHPSHVASFPFLKYIKLSCHLGAFASAVPSAWRVQPMALFVWLAPYSTNINSDVISQRLPSYIT